MKHAFECGLAHRGLTAPTALGVNSIALARGARIRLVSGSTAAGI